MRPLTPENFGFPFVGNGTTTKGKSGWMQGWTEALVGVARLASTLNTPGGGDLWRDDGGGNGKAIAVAAGPRGARWIGWGAGGQVESRYVAHSPAGCGCLPLR